MEVAPVGSSSSSSNEGGKVSGLLGHKHQGGELDKAAQGEALGGTGQLHGDRGGIC
jgi:hypothetical protein